MLALIGVLMFVASSYLALSKKMHLMVPFIVVPVIAGLLAGFPLTDLLNFAGQGVQGVFNTVLLCVFAVLYFSVLSETGMFDIMVNRLVSITKGNIYIVMLVTIIVAFIGHLDGAYNTTYLIAIPALAPLYKRLNIDRRCLVLLVSLAATPMCAMAWGTPAKMPAFAPEIDPVQMANSLLPSLTKLIDVRTYTNKVYKLMEIDPDKHVPPLVKLKWSTLQFKGFLVSCSIQFVRFSEQGTPLRAWMDCTFQEYISPDKAHKPRPLESPDTTKYRTVHAGDSLWALSAKEYGQPEQWRSIADANRLSNPRLLRSGERLVLPALKKEK